jgi:hypothetical protein
MSAGPDLGAVFDDQTPADAVLVPIAPEQADRLLGLAVPGSSA